MADIRRLNKNIVTQKFLTQKFANEINVNYGIMYCMYNEVHKISINLCMIKLAIQHHS